MQHGAAAELLARVPLMRGIGGELLLAILQTGVPVRFRANDALAFAGTDAEAGLIILEGEVALWNSDGQQFGETLSPGMCISDMAMIVETRHHFSAFATEDGLALSLKRESIGLLMGQYPGLAMQLAQNITQNLAATAQTLRELDDLLGSTPLDVPQIYDAEPMMLPSGTSDEIGGMAELENSSSERDMDPASQGNELLVPVQDLLADLSAVIPDSDQIPQEPEYDQTVFPSHGPLQSPAARLPYDQEQASSIYDQVGGPDLMHANPGPGSSTR